MNICPSLTKTSSDNSCQCKFIPLGEKKGIKLFVDECHRDEHYDNQEMVFLKDSSLAPEVFEKVDLGEEHLFRYGYVTEKIKSFTKAKFGTPEGDKAIKSLNKIDLSNYVSEVYDAGFDFYDDHPWNLGYKGGRLICLDFGND